MKAIEYADEIDYLVDNNTLFSVIREMIIEASDIMKSRGCKKLSSEIAVLDEQNQKFKALLKILRKRFPSDELLQNIEEKKMDFISFLADIDNDLERVYRQYKNGQKIYIHK